MNPIFRAVTPYVCLALFAGLPMGCATAPVISPDEAAIRQTLNAWKTAMMAKDLEGIMAAHSLHYNQDGKDLSSARAFYASAIKDGELNNAIVVTEHATIEIEGDKALVSPIAISKPVGSGSMRLRLARENGKWLIVGMDWP